MQAKLPRSAAVYAIHNIVTGDDYVGGSTNVAQRWYTHKHKLNRGVSTHTKLQAAWTQYGEDAFRVLVLELVDDAAQLVAREQHYLDTMRPVYNTRLSADNSIPIPLSPESRAIVTAKITGKPKPEGFGEAVGRRRRGVKHRAESIEKMRLAKANVSQETRDKMSAAKEGIAPEAAIKAAAIANRGKQRSPEDILKIKAGMRARWAARKAELLANTVRDDAGRFTEKPA